MSTALAITAPRDAAGFTPEQIDIIKNSVAKGVSDQELAYFLEVCRSTGLNPLHRQIYAIVRSGKMTIQTGIDGYRLLASRSRRHAGTDDAVYDTEDQPHPSKATVTVYRLTGGQRCAYTATARWSEYNQENSQMWHKMPYLLLGKCAEALALRKAFPAETSGIYTDDEMMQADNPPPLPAPVTAMTPLPAILPPNAVTQRMVAEVIEEAQTRLAKPSTEDRWEEQHQRALMLGVTEKQWQQRKTQLKTVDAVRKALDAKEQQIRDEELAILSASPEPEPVRAWFGRTGSSSKNTHRRAAPQAAPVRAVSELHYTEKQWIALVEDCHDDLDTIAHSLDQDFQHLKTTSGVH